MCPFPRLQKSARLQPWEIIRRYSIEDLHLSQRCKLIAAQYLIDGIAITLDGRVLAKDSREVNIDNFAGRSDHAELSRSILDGDSDTIAVA